MRRGTERVKEKKLDVFFRISSCFFFIFFRWGNKGKREIIESVFVDAVLKSAADCRELEWRFGEYEE